DPVFASFSLLFFGAFSEVNFTTERAQHYGGGYCHSAHGTCKGTSLVDGKPGVIFWLQGDVVVHFSAHGAGAHVSRGPFRDGGFDIAAVAGQPVFAAVAEVADVVDSAAGRNHLHQRAIHAAHGNVPAQGVHLNVPVLDVVQIHGAVHGFHVNVSI